MAITMPAFFKSVETWVASVYHKTTPVSVQTFFKNSAPYILSPTKWSRPVQLLTAGSAVVGISVIMYFKYRTPKTEAEGFNDRGKPTGATGGDPAVSGTKEGGAAKRSEGDVPLTEPTKELEAATLKLRSAQEELDNARNEHRNADQALMNAHEPRNSSRTCEAEAVNNHRKALTNLEEAKKNLSSLQVTADSAKQALEFAEGDLKKTEGKCEAAQKQATKAQADLDAARTRYTNIEELTNKTRDELRTAEARFNELSKQKQSLPGKKKTLDELNKSANTAYQQYLQQQNSGNPASFITKLEAEYKQAQEAADTYSKTYHKICYEVLKELDTAENNHKDKHAAHRNSLLALEGAQRSLDNKQGELALINTQLTAAKQNVDKMQEFVKQARIKAEEAEQPANKQVIEAKIEDAKNKVTLQEKAVQDAARDEETAKQKAVTAQQNFDLKKQELEAAKKKATEAKEKVALCEKAVEDAKKKIPINHLSGE